MKNPKAYQSYFGGKEGNGTYQTIINQIPPHNLYVSLFLGNDAVYRHLKPAPACLLNDLDSDVVEAWKPIFKTDYLHALRNDNALDMLRNLDMMLNQFCVCLDNTIEGVMVPFIFLDPPYLIETRKNKREVYKHEMQLFDHTVLLQSVNRGRFGCNIVINQIFIIT